MNKSQKQAIQNAINKCRFPVIWDDTNKQRYIEVPTDHADNWKDCMFASYLNKEFNFSIQLVLQGSVEVKETFDPKLTERIVKTEPIKEGEFLQPNNDYRITYYNEYSFVMKLIRINNGEYTWINKFGAEITNKQRDIDSWIRLGEIERI